MKKIQDICLAVVGATGAVGREVIRILEQRELFPRSIRFAASSKSAGQTILFKGQPVEVETLSSDFFDGVDVAICSAGSAVSKKYVQPEILKNTVAIDNCSFHRMDSQVPLIVPEVNGSALSSRPSKSIIANPNCTTIGMVVGLRLMHQHFQIKKIICSSYQSVSGAGQHGIDELEVQLSNAKNPETLAPHVFPQKIAFNLIPNIGGVMQNEDTVEEKKMVDETRKIFGDSSIQLAATCVRVPTFIGQGLSLYVETHKNIDTVEARKLLAQSPGVTLKDDKHGSYPVLSDCQGQDNVFVGRFRPGMTKNSFQMWSVSDNLRKGAALNAVQILESVLTQDWI